MNNRPHKFPIGTKFQTRTGKASRLCTVIDHMTVTNSKGEVVKTFYQASHDFCGQQVIDHDVCEVTIARGLITDGGSGMAASS